MSAAGSNVGKPPGNLQADRNPVEAWLPEPEQIRLKPDPTKA
jgi:hypothetical protein